MESVVSAAVGGQAATQVIQGEKLFDLAVCMQPQFRGSAHEIGQLLVGTPDGKQVRLSESATISQGNGTSFIYRPITTTALVACLGLLLCAGYRYRLGDAATVRDRYRCRFDLSPFHRLLRESSLVPDGRP